MSETKTIRNIPRSEVVKSGATCELPRDRYTLRVLKHTFGLSKSSGEPMTTVETEILKDSQGNSEITVNGINYNIASLKVVYYISYSEKNMGNVYDLFERLGNPVEEINRSNPDTKFLNGLVFDAVLSSKRRIARKAPQPGEKEGQPILDSEGKEVSTGFEVSNNLGDILGVSSLTPGASY